MFYLKNIFLILSFCFNYTYSQNSTDKMLETSDLGSIIGSYGEVHFNSQEKIDYSSLDVHRLVMLFGYKFSERVTMATEIEIEHINELSVEQVFLNYSINNFLNLKTGLILSPMGIVNLYHEPTTFNGVERPNVDKYIIPSTWREIGFGLHGRFLELSINYQLYVMNGFNGYDEDGGIFSGSSGLRAGRQKGAESYMSAPNVTGRIDFYGIPNLKVGLAGYFGDSQSKTPSVDSTVVGIAMFGGDFRYRWNELELKGQYTVVNIDNTENYNALNQNNLGSLLTGYYFECGYNILSFFSKKSENKIITFMRYEHYNTHAETEGELVANPEYDRTEVTIGAGYKVDDGVVLKADYQIKSNESGNDAIRIVNLGIGWWF